jgi:hypothetical protein
MDNFSVNSGSQSEFVFCNTNFFDYKLKFIPRNKISFGWRITSDSVFRYNKDFYKKGFFLSFVRLLSKVDNNILKYVNPNHFISIKDYVNLFDEYVRIKPANILFLNLSNVLKINSLRLIKLVKFKDFKELI